MANSTKLPKARKRYTKAICDKLPELFAEGQSIAEVAKALGISKSTFYDWKTKYPEFGVAVEKGVATSEAWWREQGRKAVRAKDRQFPAALWIFTMKSRFGDTDQPQPEPPSAEQLEKMGIHINIHPTVAQELKQKAAEAEPESPDSGD